MIFFVRRWVLLLLVVPVLGMFALAFHGVLWLVSFLCALAGLEITWPPIPLATEVGRQDPSPAPQRNYKG